MIHEQAENWENVCYFAGPSGSFRDAALRGGRGVNLKRKRPPLPYPQSGDTAALLTRIYDHKPTIVEFSVEQKFRDPLVFRRISSRDSLKDLKP